MIEAALEVEVHGDRRRHLARRFVRYRFETQPAAGFGELDEPTEK